MWKEEYGVATLDVGIVTISVAYAMVGTGYQYFFGAFVSKQAYKSKDEAKEAALIAVSARLETAQREITKARVVSVKAEE